MGKSRLWNLKALIVIVLIGGAVGAFLSFGPPKLLAKSETPEFCSSCHVMEAQYEAWFHEGAHRRVKCVDCHLPHQNLALHYTWKTIDGMKDVYVFYSGRVPDPIELSGRGQKVLQKNCIRCHGETVAKIDNERNCWECHRRLSHIRSGTIAVR